MAPLVRTSLFIRRLARKGHGLALTCALGAYVVHGGATAPLGAIQVLALVAWGVLLGRRLRTKLSRRAMGEAPLYADVELGALLAVGLDAALLRYEGGLSGSLSPATYVLVALVASFARPLAGLAVVLWVVVLEGLIRYFTLHEPSFETLATHATFAFAFALLNLASLRAEVLRVRSTAQGRVEDELRRLKEDARSYRLLGAGEERPAQGGEDRLARSSVEEIHQSVHYALELLRRTLDLHTAVLLWQNDAGSHLRISELSTASDEIHDAPFSVNDGVLAVVVKRRECVLLKDLRPSYKVPYYASACPVSVLAAIPVLEEQETAERGTPQPSGVDRAAAQPQTRRPAALRGILAIDRTDNRPFTPHEQELAAQAARYCLRAIQNERVFVQLERAKVEQGKLYRAAQSLGAALSEKEVLEAGVRAAREIAAFELAAVTIFDEKTKTHEVCAATSEGGEIDDLVGAKYAHNAGLVSMVVQNRFPLPYKGDFDAQHQVVLTKRYPWPKLPSLLVLPLLLHGRPLGTLILGARRRHAFGDAVRPTLEVLASHLAVSLSNARMVQKLETMATTDGLTGLLNKRAMLERATQKVAAAARFGRKLSMLICDIDFFKKVNDTHGHDIGDVVIRGLGDVLKSQKRTTDVVARFGGEEFVVLCEQTDESGAMLLAERIREELERATFTARTGTFGVTCSVGVATFPEAGKDWDALFHAADEALYVAKRSGRNRAIAHQPRPSEMRLRDVPSSRDITAPAGGGDKPKPRGRKAG